MTLDIKQIGCHPSNYAKGRAFRRAAYRPEAIVIHVMDGTLVGTDAFFNQPRPGAASSAHYGIGHPWKQPDVLAVHQYVADEDTAYHAGVVSNPTWKLWKPGVNPNLYTIGIEHEGDAKNTWSDAMYRLSARLVRSLCDKWNIPISRDHILGHREIYAVKPCPGRCDLDLIVALAKGEKS